MSSLPHVAESTDLRSDMELDVLFAGFVGQCPQAALGPHRVPIRNVQTSIMQFRTRTLFPKLNHFFESKSTTQSQWRHQTSAQAGAERKFESMSSAFFGHFLSFGPPKRRCYPVMLSFFKVLCVAAGRGRPAIPSFCHSVIGPFWLQTAGGQVRSWTPSHSGGLSQ